MISPRCTLNNLQAAHHAILYAIPETRTSHINELDAQDDKEGYVCFGDPGDQEAEHIAGWAPGGGVQVLPEGAVKRVPAGSQLVLQMHYFTASLAADESHTDHTEVQVWTAPPDMEIDSVVISPDEGRVGDPLACSAIARCPTNIAPWPRALLHSSASSAHFL